MAVRCLDKSSRLFELSSRRQATDYMFLHDSYKPCQRWIVADSTMMMDDIYGNRGVVGQMSWERRRFEKGVAYIVYST